MVEPPKTLKLFKGEEDIDFSLLNKGGVDLFAEPKMGSDNPSPHRHPVNLALLHIEAGFHKNFRHDITGQDHTLSSNTGHQDIGYMIVHFISLINSAGTMEDWKDGMMG
jgi:hypothetical protein